MPKEILVVTGIWPTNQNPISGIFVAQQVNALCAAGVTVTVLAPRFIIKGGRHLDPAELGLSNSVKFHSVPVMRLPEKFSNSQISLHLNSWLTGLAIRFKLSRIYNRISLPDGCIMHGIRYAGASTPFWLNQFKIKSLLFIHGVDPFLHKDVAVGWLSKLAPSLNHLLSNFVLVGSPLRSHVEQLGLDAGRTIVIPNGTDIVSENDNGVREEGRISFDEGPIKIVSVSNLIPLKGVDGNINAINILRNKYSIDNLLYTIVGDGPERTRLEGLVKSLGLEEQILFLGRLPYKDTMQAISAAHIFSLPSWGEAFGIVYLEAMARSKPAIGCLNNGAADIITDGRDGLLVPPKDPEVLALALKKLIDDRDLYSSICKNARVKSEDFTWDVNAGRVLDCLFL